MFVSYLTIYSGDKLPPFYIGSSFIENVLENNYHGSVSSLKYKSIYDLELIENPELFDTIILSEFKTRKEATANELYWQRRHKVVENPLFFNMAYATVDGFFGKDILKDTIHSYNPKTGQTYRGFYIPDGFIKGRPDIKGRKQYNNGIETRTFFEDEVPDGWVLGRKDIKGRSWYNNGVKSKMYFSNEVPPGWIKGRLDNTTLGKKWFNDGVKSKLFFEGSEPSGWKLGNLNNIQFFGTRLYTNGIELKQFKEGEQPEGWTLKTNKRK